MSISPMAMKAYTEALQSGNPLNTKSAGNEKVYDDFSTTIKESLSKVNSLQGKKSKMIQAFAAGENENVHELMIAMQKSSVAMKLTTAVRGKVLEAYKSLMQTQF
ncbi:MAG: flagellar hook-basal body complex protein FliE [Desulfonatronovibrionaceae bacterium]